MHRDSEISLQSTLYNVQTSNTPCFTRSAPRDVYYTVKNIAQTSNTPCPHRRCTEIEPFYCTDDQLSMSPHEVHRDRAISLHSTLYHLQARNTPCPPTSSQRWSYFNEKTCNWPFPNTSRTEIELVHCTIHCTLYSPATRHFLKRVAQRCCKFSAEYTVQCTDEENDMSSEVLHRD
jgi:hypothetical protein